MKKLCWLMLALALMLAVAAAAAESGTVSYGKLTFSTDAELIDLGSTRVSDFDGFAAFLAKFPNLKQVNMFSTKIYRSQCDALAKQFPDMRWGWSMVIRSSDHEHIVRTDQTSFSTLHNNKSSEHSSQDFSVLKHCWHLYALDIGHNAVNDLSFLEDLPDLRVLIVACNQITDISPLAKLTNLEYAELFKNKITDITPLVGLTHLLDLNICFNRVRDITPLKQMKWLKRLFMYSCQSYNSDFPYSVRSEYKAALPDTFVDLTSYSTAGTWRYSHGEKKTPHYACIVATFGDSHLRPSIAYYPFDDSWPFTEEELAIIKAAQEAQAAQKK